MVVRQTQHQIFDITLKFRTVVDSMGNLKCTKTRSDLWRFSNGGTWSRGMRPVGDALVSSFNIDSKNAKIMSSSCFIGKEILFKKIVKFSVNG